MVDFNISNTSVVYNYIHNEDDKNIDQYCQPTLLDRMNKINNLRPITCGFYCQESSKNAYTSLFQ